ncbi:MAG: GNAT family N-acetyltransferase [Hyphomonadaceae bacterium]|nr:GNAT family N-acetyltransferase [Hyphomonadaceae bacterium]
MTTIGPTLTTARLILRPPQHEDFDGFAEMSAEEETMRFIGGVGPRDAAWRGMAMLAGSWSLLGHGMFSVLRRDTGEWIGRLGPWRPGGKEGGWPGDEVGWGLKRAAMGQGYAQEGATAAIDWAFDALGWDHVIHCIDKENAPSIALALRLGSRREREDVPLPAPYDMHKVDIYGQSRAQWEARQR